MLALSFTISQTSCRSSGSEQLFTAKVYDYHVAEIAQLKSEIRRLQTRGVLPATADNVDVQLRMQPFGHRSNKPK